MFEPLLVALRADLRLKERSRGFFYWKSAGFLYSHAAAAASAPDLATAAALRSAADAAAIRALAKTRHQPIIALVREGIALVRIEEQRIHDGLALLTIQEHTQTTVRHQQRP